MMATHTGPVALWGPEMFRSLSLARCYAQFPYLKLSCLTFVTRVRTIRPADLTPKPRLVAEKNQGFSIFRGYLSLIIGIVKMNETSKKRVDAGPMANKDVVEDKYKCSISVQLH